MNALFANRRAHATWGVVALLAVALSYGVAEDRRVVLAVIGLVGLTVGAALAAHEPRWAVVLLVFGAYATLFEAAQNATGLPLSKRMTIVAVAVLIAWRRAAGASLRLPARMHVGLVGALVGVMATSALVAVDPGTTVTGLLSVTTAAAVALMISTFDEPRWLARAMWATALGGAVMATVSLYQQATATYSNTYFGLAVVKLDAGVARSGGPFEPNFFAQALVLATALAVYLAVRATSSRERAGGLAVAAICVAGVASTASRGGVLALAVMLVLLLVLRRPRVRIVIPVAVVAVVAGSMLLPPETSKRISSLAGATDVEQSMVHDTSFRGRFAENVTAVHMVRDNPLLGVGSGNFPVRYAEYSTFAGREWRPVRQPHNLYLEAFAETGVVGGTVFLVFLGITVRGVWQARQTVRSRDALLAEGVFVGLVGVLTTSIFLHAAFLSTLWTAFGLAWAAAAMGRVAASRPLSLPSRG